MVVFCAARGIRTSLTMLSGAATGSAVNDLSRGTRQSLTMLSGAATGSAVN